MCYSLLVIFYFYRMISLRNKDAFNSTKPTHLTRNEAKYDSRERKSHTRTIINWSVFSIILFEQVFCHSPAQTNQKHEVLSQI